MHSIPMDYHYGPSVILRVRDTTVSKMTTLSVYPRGTVSRNRFTRCHQKIIEWPLPGNETENGCHSQKCYHGIHFQVLNTVIIKMQNIVSDRLKKYIHNNNYSKTNHMLHMVVIVWSTVYWLKYNLCVVATKADQKKKNYETLPQSARHKKYFF